MISMYISKMIKLNIIKRPYKRFMISDRKIVKKLEIIFSELRNTLINDKIEPDYNLDIFNMPDDGDIIKACQYILYIEKLFNEFEFCFYDLSCSLKNFERVTYKEGGAL